MHDLKKKGGMRNSVCGLGLCGSNAKITGPKKSALRMRYLLRVETSAGAGLAGPIPSTRQSWMKSVAQSGHTLPSVSAQDQVPRCFYHIVFHSMRARATKFTPRWRQGQWCPKGE